MFDKFIEKILANDDKFIIFYSEWCRYCTDAIQLLKTKEKYDSWDKVATLGVWDVFGMDLLHNNTQLFKNCKGIPKENMAACFIKRSDFL